MSERLDYIRMLTFITSVDVTRTLRITMMSACIDYIRKRRRSLPVWTRQAHTDDTFEWWCQYDPKSAIASCETCMCWKLTLDSEQINTWTFPWLTTVPPQINPIAKLSASLPNWPHQIRCFCGERKCGGSERTGVLPVYPSSQPRQNIFPSIRNANDTKSILVRAMCCAFCLPVAVAGLFCLN